MPSAAMKAEIRAASLAARGRLDPVFRRRASRWIADRVLAAVPRFSAGPVSAYWPIRDEVDTVELLNALHAAGCRLALPVVHGATLVFRAWQPGDALQRARFGLSEPLAGAPELAPVTMLVPLAAFDRRCNRIGYGAGFYDRAIAELSAQHDVHTIGLAFAVQQVAHVPVEAHDRALHRVVTEDGDFGSVTETA